MDKTRLKTDPFYWAGLLLICFSLWHAPMRGIWSGSIRNSLHIGEWALPLAQSVDPKIQRYKPYDGQYFYAMTFDPLLFSKKAIPFIDAPSYRYHRMFYPLLGFVFALGQPFYYPFSLFFINVLFWFLLGWGIWKWSTKGAYPQTLMVFGGMITTGVVFCVFRTLPETMALCCVLWSLYFYHEKKWGVACLIAACAALTRETTAVAFLSFALFTVVHNKQEWKKLLLLVLSFGIPLILWWGYVDLRLPNYNFIESKFFSIPIWGMIQEIQNPMHPITTQTERMRTYSLFILALILIFVCVIFFRKKPTLWGALALGEALFVSCVRGNIWDSHASSARVLIPLMVFGLLWFLERKEIKT